ncbi:brix domain-containing protein [Cavenderia fasciculata]|uniref:Ribosome production factor 2 homolog n=1 Tax=Cavenderia fasciculata TaxID=261658 RepID=F4PSS2_CACFS|nr:brix domain-containing protein [Cavenderia fasciculata]EGG21550.1 brix domain-containing protein [Cavenderia fasciculata]|eukprot:XP_004359400.1 brix domain-containing protein [Cavenderia fasciculata]
MSSIKPSIDRSVGRSRQMSKSAKAKAFLRSKESQEVEHYKQAMMIRGKWSSQIIQNVLKDFYILKKPNAVQYNKKNDIYPMESAESIEFLGEKSVSGLFAFGSHSYKRPHNLVIGRLFDDSVFDMYEFSVLNYKGMEQFQGATTSRLGNKPCFIFNGAEFENDPITKRIGNTFLDFFRGHVVEYINLAGLDHVIILTAVNGRILFRHYSVLFKRSGTKVPRVELEEMGPSFDLELRRSKIPSEDVEKQALKIHRSVQPKVVKNVDSNDLGEKHGRIHLGKQDYNTLAFKKTKALSKRKQSNHHSTASHSSNDI